MNDVASCAHRRIEYVPDTDVLGVTRDRWRCCDCLHPFAPAPAAPSEIVVHGNGGNVMLDDAAADREQYELVGEIAELRLRVDRGDLGGSGSSEHSVSGSERQPTVPSSPIVEALFEYGRREWEAGRLGQGTNLDTTARRAILNFVKEAEHALRQAREWADAKGDQRDAYAVQRDAAESRCAQLLDAVRQKPE